MSDIVERLVEIGLRGRIAELEAELARLRDENELLHDELGCRILAMQDEIERLREELASIGRAQFCDEERIAEQDAEIVRLRAERNEYFRRLISLAAMNG